MTTLTDWTPMFRRAGMLALREYLDTGECPICGDCGDPVGMHDDSCPFGGELTDAELETICTAEEARAK